MKKSIKKLLAVVLSLVMLSSLSICFAAELNEEAVNKHYGQYKNYVLLGDSAASGYRDEVSENDAAFNLNNEQSTYYRIEGSYADIIADTIIEDGSMTALAAPGFRTLEVRYMLEDEYAATCEDEFLFHPSQLYVHEWDYCSCHGELMLPYSRHYRELFKNSIANADLITLGIGGNDWGEYMRWVIDDLLKKENVADQYIAQIADIFDDGLVDLATIQQAVDILHIAGALPALLTTLPSALEYGLSTFYTNWDIMIQDIYDLNPDVTLVVVGMSDNSIKGKYYDYNGVPGESVIPEGTEEDPTKAAVMSTIINFIMGVGNGPMIEGEKKFGYTYVDIDGASYVESHYDADGHVFVANKIIEALPDAEISKQFTDATPGHKYYKEIEYVVLNGIMSGTSEITFSPDEALTKTDMIAAFNVINKTNVDNGGSSSVSALKLALEFIMAGAKGGFKGLVRGLSICTKIIADKGFNVFGTITRAEAANYFTLFCA